MLPMSEHPESVRLVLRQWKVESGYYKIPYLLDPNCQLSLPQRLMSSFLLLSKSSARTSQRQNLNNIQDPQGEGFWEINSACGN